MYVCDMIYYYWHVSGTFLILVFTGNFADLRAVTNASAPLTKLHK